MLERVPLLEKDLADYERDRRRGGDRAHPGARRAARAAPGSSTSTPRPTAAASPSCSPPTSRSCEPRHRGRVAGDPRQRRVLRGHEGGAQRAAGRATCRGPRTCRRSTSRRCSTTRCCSRASGTTSSSTTRSPRRSSTFIGYSTRQPARDQVDLAVPHRPHRRATRTCGSSSVRYVERYDASVWTMDRVRPRLARRWTTSSRRRRASTRCR